MKFFSRRSFRATVLAFLVVVGAEPDIAAETKKDVYDRLQKTVVPRMAANQWNLNQVCDFLNAGDDQWSVDGKSTNFQFIVKPEFQRTFAATGVITLEVTQIPVLKLLEYATTLVHARYKIHAGGVTVLPYDDVATFEELYDFDDWTERAHILYPDSAIEGTPLRIELQSEIVRLKSSNPDFFKRKDWPMALAAMVSQRTPSSRESLPLSRMTFEFVPSELETTSQLEIRDRVKRSLTGDSREVAARVIPATVTIEATLSNGGVSQGSGFHIGGGRVVTNHHVIRDSTSSVVKFPGKQTTYTQTGLVFSDEKNDLAVLSIKDDGNPKIENVNLALPTVGAKIYAAGSPRGLESTFSDGIVSAIRQVNGLNRIQITAPGLRCFVWKRG